MDIVNKATWWAVLDGNFFNIARLIHKFLPNGSVLRAQTLQAARDPALVDLLQKVWDEAPDAPSIHSLAGWGPLCDLCTFRDMLHLSDEDAAKITAALAERNGMTIKHIKTREVGTTRRDIYLVTFRDISDTTVKIVDTDSACGTANVMTFTFHILDWAMEFATKYAHLVSSASVNETTYHSQIDHF